MTPPDRGTEDALIAKLEAVAADLNTMDYVLLNGQRVNMVGTIHEAIARVTALEAERNDAVRLLANKANEQLAAAQERAEAAEAKVAAARDLYVQEGLGREFYYQDDSDYGIKCVECDRIRSMAHKDGCKVWRFEVALGIGLQPLPHQETKQCPQCHQSYDAVHRRFGVDQRGRCDNCGLSLEAFMSPLPAPPTETT